MKLNIFSIRKLPLFHLRGYIETYSDLNINWKYVNFPISLEDINNISSCNKENNFLCISLSSIYDYPLFVESINMIRKYATKNFILAIGGTLMSLIDLDQFQTLFPEVNYIVTGKGEKALLYLLNNGGIIKNKIINGNTLGVIERYIPSAKGQSIVSLAMNPDICPWNKCSFCHHTKKWHLTPLTPYEFAAQINYLYKKYDIKSFYIYDNCLTPKQIEKFLSAIDKLGLNNKINIELFGLRISKDLLRLKKIFLKTDVIKIVNWGLEFLSDDVLYRCHKGTDVATIYSVLKEFKNWHVFNSAYILYGLPQVSENSLIMHQKNYQKIRQYLDRIRISWFLVTPGIEIFQNAKQWDIEIINRYTLENAFGNNNSFYKLKMAFYDFKSANPETGVMMSRWQDFLRHKSIINNTAKTYPITTLHTEMFFLAMHSIYKHFNEKIIFDYPLIQILSTLEK